MVTNRKVTKLLLRSKSCIDERGESIDEDYDEKEYKSYRLREHLFVFRVFGRIILLPLPFLL